jgi:aryl-alcohol dehydrogenase-like predicted oxidoreductase
MVNSSLVRFGTTDLYVSRLCQGTAFRTLPRTGDDRMGQQVLRRCLDLGVNFFDSSNAYGWGGSETALGKAVAGCRDRVVICTKVAPVHPPEREGAAPQPARFTRDFLFRQAEGSLDRLGTDYIDLYLLHQPDNATPAGEIVEAMDGLVRAGKIRYWGVSNHSAERVGEYAALGLATGRAPLAGIEDYYTVALTERDAVGAFRVRLLERDMFPVVRQARLGLLAFSPLDTGRLAPGRTAEPGTPLAALLAVLDRVARDLGVGRAEVCIAWVLTHPEVTSVLAGAESPEHAAANVAGTTLTLPAEAMAALEAARFANTP